MSPLLVEQKHNLQLHVAELSMTPTPIVSIILHYRLAWSFSMQLCGISIQKQEEIPRMQLEVSYQNNYILLNAAYHQSLWWHQKPLTAHLWTFYTNNKTILHSQIIKKTEKDILLLVENILLHLPPQRAVLSQALA